MVSTGASRSVVEVVPFSLDDATANFSKGIATSFAVLNFLLPLPAWTVLRSKDWVLTLLFPRFGMTRIKSSACRPARPQKYQQSGAPAIFPSSM